VFSARFLGLIEGLDDGQCLEDRMTVGESTVAAKLVLEA
jgi:hypothetical protein